MARCISGAITRPNPAPAITISTVKSGSAISICHPLRRNIPNATRPRPGRAIQRASSQRSSNPPNTAHTGMVAVMRSSHRAAVKESTGRPGTSITVLAIITVVAMAMIRAIPTSSWDTLAVRNAPAPKSAADKSGCAVRRCRKTKPPTDSKTPPSSHQGVQEDSRNNPSCAAARHSSASATVRTIAPR